MAIKNNKHLKDIVSSFPENAGVYRMHDAKGNILYIGKAKHLRKRVLSYFSASPHIKVQALLSHVDHIDFIVTLSEKEALVLERQLIRSYQPRYNILLKDDKRYPYIELTAYEPFPKISIAREKKNARSLYFGPYPAIGSVNNLLKLILDLFPIRTCKQAISKTERNPKCILLDLKRCIGPCVYKNTLNTYQSYIEQIILLLKGKNKTVIQILHKTMKALAKETKFEEALVIKKKIEKLTYLAEKQYVEMDKNLTAQIWTYKHQDGIDYILIQNIENGLLLSQNGYYQIDEESGTFKIFFEQTVLNYWTEHHPNNILCSQNIYEKLDSISKSLNIKMTLATPKIGDKNILLLKATHNLDIAIQFLLSKHHKNKKPTVTSVLNSLKICFNLNVVPYIIMGFDISHLQGSHIVASSVCFKHGQPDKSRYRIFPITALESESNDPLCIKEAVLRRMKQCHDEHQAFPQLILVDGGISQLHFAHQALMELQLKTIALISLAKKEEEIYTLNHSQPVRLKKSDPILHLLQNIRDESHRFALKHQRKQRKKDLHSGIRSIKGIGNTYSQRIHKLLNDYPPKEVTETLLIDKVKLPPSLTQDVLRLLNQMPSLK